VPFFLKAAAYWPAIKKKAKERIHEKAEDTYYALQPFLTTSVP
jgi:hypothetical protein